MLVRYEICLAIYQLLNKIPFVNTERKINRYKFKIGEYIRQQVDNTNDSFPYVYKSFYEQMGDELKKTFHPTTYACEYFTTVSMDSTVGKYCSIAANVSLGTTFHPTSWLSTHPFQYFEPQKFSKKHSQRPWQFVRPVHVGNDVWIGKGAVIMDGVTVGDGAIIGTHAVVTHDVPPYAIVVGVPARVLRYRFDEPTRKKLLELKWWDMSQEDLQDLPYDDVQKCIEILTSKRKILI